MDQDGYIFHFFFNGTNCHNSFARFQKSKAYYEFNGKGQIIFYRAPDHTTYEFDYEYRRWTVLDLDTGEYIPVQKPNFER